jgi:hypothetical protein
MCIALVSLQRSEKQPLQLPNAAEKRVELATHCWDPRSVIGHEPLARLLTRSRLAPGEKYVRENEAVAVDPVWVLGVESHELVEHDVGHRSHAHRGTRMTRVGLKGGIDL